MFLFTNIYRLAVGSTQPPVQWVLGAHSTMVKLSECEADHSPPSSVMFKNVGTNLHMVKCLSTKTTLV
jgi:hypothetical protein